MAFRALLGDGRIMTLGLGAMVCFGLTAALGWGLGVSGPTGPSLTTPPLPDSSGPTDRLLGVVGVLPGIVRESSGVAVSRQNANHLWTHNDGGDARVFLLSERGSLKGIVRVLGADVEDLEDIAVGPCGDLLDAASCLYLSDTGDNGRDRDSYSILIAREPDFTAGPQTTIRRDITFNSIRFRYPDGSRDAEALAVSPEGRLLVITKGQEGAAELFEVPTTGEGAPIVEATSISLLPLNVEDKDNRVTGAAVSPSGDLLAARSDEALYVFRMGDISTWLHRCTLPEARQGEGVDFLDEDHFVVTREGRGAPIEVTQCP